MNDEFKDVDEVIGAMRRRGQTLPPLRFASSEEMMATVDRLRRRRRLVRAAVVLAAAGLAAVVAALLLPTDSAKPVAGATTALPGPSPPPQPSGETPELRWMQPYPELVAFADQQAKVEFPSPRRVVLAAGAVVLRYRGTTAGPALVVETPDALVAITGTVLAVIVSPAGTTVEVLRGRVDVTRAGRIIGVGEGQRLGAELAQPEPLPQDRARTLARLFPDERPCPPVAAVEPSGPETVAAATEPPAPSPDRPESPRADEPADSGSERVEDVGAVQDREGTGDLARVRDPEETYALAEDALRARRYGEAREHLEVLLAAVTAGSTLEETALVDLARTCERLGDERCVRDSLVRYLDRHPSGVLREQVRVDLCRLYERSGPASALAPCLRDYLAEFPDGRNVGWARDLLSPEPASSSPNLRVEGLSPEPASSSPNLRVEGLSAPPQEPPMGDGV